MTFRAPAQARATAPERDQDIIERLLAGDERTFVQLVERHRRAMYGVASTFTNNAALAEEIVQETWMAVLAGLTSFERRSSLKTWIFRILANRGRTRAAREARTVPLSSLSEEGLGEPLIDAARFNEHGMWVVPPRPWELDTPEAILSRAQTLALVERAIASLPPRQRAVLLLCDVEQLDPAEVAELLELTGANQRVLLHRARTAIRNALESELGKAP